MEQLYQNRSIFHYLRANFKGYMLTIDHSLYPNPSNRVNDILNFLEG